MMISSPQNPLVKYVRKLLHKSAFRRKERKFVAEGRREVSRAISGGFRPEKLLICPAIFGNEIPAEWKNYDLTEVTPHVYEQLAYRGGTEGVTGIFEQKSFDNVPQISEKNPLILVAENIQKPGNIGALLRTADAAGTDAVIFIDPLTDLYNPNVIRASLGTLFHLKIWVTDLPEFGRFVSERAIKVYAATLQNSEVYWRANFKLATAIAVGAEDKGLTTEFRALADEFVYIPMKGIADSLNVSVSAAVLIYEAVRQRND